MKTAIAILLVLAAVALLPWPRSSAAAPSSVLDYKPDGQLALPADYREWVYLSSGIGMNYGPVVAENPDRPTTFDNVFANPAAYRYFVQNGKWPEKTMLVLEVRRGATKGSINNGGHYQTGLIAVEANVKDTSRFPNGGWAFFAFGKETIGKQIPTTAACYTCHADKAAADNSFVQFYPTLLPVASGKGTLNPKYVAAESH